MMSDPLRLAIHLNNLAASQIENNNSEAAIQVLSSALDPIQAIMGQDRPTFHQPTPKLIFRQVETDHDSLQAGFVYRHPVVMPSTSGCSTNMAATIILFNLALAHQLLAMDKIYSDGQTTLLENSAMFYGVSLNLLGQCRGVQINESFLAIATLNNLGLVHRALGDDAAAENRLGQLLFFLVQWSGSNRVASWFDNFLRNTHFYNHITAAAA